MPEVLSAHRTLAEALGGGMTGEVLAVYRKAINLTGDICGGVWCVGWNQAARDPFTLCTGACDLTKLPISPGHAARLAGNTLQIGEIAFQWEEPMQYTISGPAVSGELDENSIKQAQRLLEIHRPIGLPGHAQFIDRKTALLEAMRRGNKSEVLLQGKRLLGLGPGLTPSGDDWLAGMMLVGSLPGSLLEPYRDLWPLLVSSAPSATGQMGEAVLLRAQQGLWGQYAAAYMLALSGKGSVKTTASLPFRRPTTVSASQ